MHNKYNMQFWIRWGETYIGYTLWAMGDEMVAFWTKTCVTVICSFVLWCRGNFGFVPNIQNSTLGLSLALPILNAFWAQHQITSTNCVPQIPIFQTLRRESGKHLQTLCKSANLWIKLCNPPTPFVKDFPFIILANYMTDVWALW